MNERSNDDVTPEAGRKPAGREQKKALSRRRILESAKDVFFRDGFMRANLDEVAEKAGVAKGTLYRYFESKADLYVAVLADNGKHFTERMREEVALAGPSATDRIQSLARFYLSYWIRHPEYFQIFWAIENEAVIGHLPEGVITEVSRLWEASLSILQEVIEEGVASGEFEKCDTWEVAHILWSIANALIETDSTKARRQLRRRPLEALFQHSISLIVRGLSARPDEVEVWSSRVEA